MCFTTMIRRLAAVILLTTVSLIQTVKVPEQIPLNVVKVGEIVTLRCSASEQTGQYLKWYKQPLGHTIQTVAAGIFTELQLIEQFNNDHFKITKEASDYILTIRNIRKEDEGTYFCGKGNTYFHSFGSGIFLAVEGHIEFSHVSQTPKIVSVQEGGTVTLECSLLFKSQENTDRCPAENRVYWFRFGPGESHPAFVYLHKNSSDTQDSRSCVYRLNKAIQKPSDTGTYYCAVVTRGQILLGQGTNVEKRPYFNVAVLILGMLLACCLTVIVTLLLYINHRVCKAANRDSSRPRRNRPEWNHSNERDTDGVNYAALDFSSRKMKETKKRTESPQECVYTTVRAGHHQLHETS